MAWQVGESLGQIEVADLRQARRFMGALPERVDGRNNKAAASAARRVVASGFAVIEAAESASMSFLAIHMQWSLHSIDPTIITTLDVPALPSKSNCIDPYPADIEVEPALPWNLCERILLPFLAAVTGPFHWHLGENMSSSDGITDKVLRESLEEIKLMERVIESTEEKPSLFLRQSASLPNGRDRGASASGLPGKRRPDTASNVPGKDSLGDLQLLKRLPERKLQRKPVSVQGLQVGSRGSEQHANRELWDFTWPFSHWTESR